MAENNGIFPFILLKEERKITEFMMKPDRIQKELSITALLPAG
jgi:hypothetical protein